MYEVDKYALPRRPVIAELAKESLPVNLEAKPMESEPVFNTDELSSTNRFMRFGWMQNKMDPLGKETSVPKRSPTGMWSRHLDGLVMKPNASNKCLKA